MLRQLSPAALRLIFALLLSESTAQGNSRQCYDVGNDTVCYFRPEDGVKMDWDDANKFCRDNNATLPVILNKDHQKTIEKYLTQFPHRNVYFFTAGRKSWSLDQNYPWRWVNGEQAQTPTFGSSEEHIFGCIVSEAAITRYVACSSYPRFSYPPPFICQYPESICETLKITTYQLHDRNHCFVIYDEHLSWYGARNKCIEGGGDLTVFDDVDTFIASSNFTSAMHEGYRFSIGLQKNWWTWQARDSFNIKFTNWPQAREYYDHVPEDFSGKHCLCLNGSNNFKWTSCNCSEGQSFLCQSAIKVAAHNENLEERSKSDLHTDNFSNASRCYDVKGTQVCYFTPENATRLNFASASQWCRDHNATLPIIRNKVYQKSLESFLKTISPPIYLLWTSGLMVKTGVWSWINGQPFRESDMGDVRHFFSFYLRAISHETLEQKRQLLRSFYDKKSSLTGYICQYPDDSCKAFSKGIRTKSNECLVAKEENVSWYEARNKCIDGGGDLATFEDVSKLDKLTSFLTINQPYQIGLENSWWIWHESEKFEDRVQYTNWQGNSPHECHWYRWCADFSPFRIRVSSELGSDHHCLCLETFKYKWTPCNCDLTFRFVCQRVESNNGSESSFQFNKTDPQYEMCGHQVCGHQGNQGLIIAGVEGLIIAVLVIVVVSLVIRSKNKSKTSENAESDEPREMDNRYTSVNTPIDPIPSEYQDLKLYEEVK